MKRLKILGLILILVAFTLVSCKQLPKDFLTLPQSFIRILKTTKKTNLQTEQIINNLKILNEKQESFIFTVEKVQSISQIMRRQVRSEKDLLNLSREELKWVKKNGYYNTRIYKNVVSMRESYYRQERMNKEIVDSSSKMLQKLEEADRLNNILLEKLNLAVTLNK